MPEQRARIEDGSGNIIVQAADSTVTIGAPATLKLYPWHRRPRRAKSDVALLNPFTLSVPFVGRAAELARLEAWLSAPPLISARCVTGRAGKRQRWTHAIPRTGPGAGDHGTGSAIFTGSCRAGCQ